MIGKIIGALAGAEAAKHARGVSGPTGAVLGAIAVPVARRMGPMGLVAALAGGYALKRYTEKRQAKDAAAKPGPV